MDLEEVLEISSSIPIAGDYLHRIEVSLNIDCDVSNGFPANSQRPLVSEAAKEIERRGDLDLAIKGFIDDDRMKLNRSVVQGHKILGTTRDLPRLVRALGIDHVVITIAQASRQEIHRIIKICEQIPKHETI